MAPVLVSVLELVVLVLVMVVPVQERVVLVPVQVTVVLVLVLGLVLVRDLETVILGPAPEKVSPGRNHNRENSCLCADIFL